MSRCVSQIKTLHWNVKHSRRITSFSNSCQERKKWKKQPGNVSRSCKCDGMSWTYAGLSFIHLILPPASCCVWINKRHHGNWNCPKKKKHYKNTMVTCLSVPATLGNKNNPFCTIVMRNITIAHFTLHVHHTWVRVHMQSAANAKNGGAYTNITWYIKGLKTYRRYLHVIDTLLVHSYMSTLKYVYTVYMYIFICIQIYQRRNK